MNGLGAVLTGVVAVVITVTKFTHGAYVVVIAIIALIAAFYTVRRHYDRVARFLQPQSPEQLERLGQVALSKPRTTVVLFVSQVNELTARSLALGRGLAPDDFHAATIASDPDHVLLCKGRGPRWGSTSRSWWWTLPIGSWSARRSTMSARFVPAPVTR